jgi:hypothetical protein
MILFTVIGIVPIQRILITIANLENITYTILMGKYLNHKIKLTEVGGDGGGGWGRGRRGAGTVGGDGARGRGAGARLDGVVARGAVALWRCGARGAMARRGACGARWVVMAVGGGARSGGWRWRGGGARGGDGGGAGAGHAVVMAVAGGARW